MDEQNAFRGFQYKVWDAHLAAASETLPMQTVANVHHFYYNLDFLMTMIRAAQIDPEREGAGQRFEQTATQLLDEGNPLPIARRRRFFGIGRQKPTPVAL